MRPENARFANGVGREEATTQYLRYILLADRTGVLFILTSQHVGDFRQQLLSQRVGLPLVGGQKRSYHGATIHFDDGLAKVLEEVDQAPAPVPIVFNEPANVHQHFVLQH